MSLIAGAGVRVPGWGWLIESPRPLSQSLLWELQRRFYARRGPEAWTVEKVPSWATSNPWVAERLARLAIAWVEDAREAGRLDPSQPVYVVELASGSGELGWHLLRALERLAPPDLPRVVVVLTDVAEANLAAYAAHPGLDRFRREGRLDLAAFDAERDDRLQLASGAALTPGAVSNPPLVLAAYLFDSLRQDAFFAARGALEAGWAALASGRRESDLEAPGVLRRLRLCYERRPVRWPHYPDEPDLDATLRRCAEALDAGAFAFPLAALRCLRRLVALSPAGLGLVVLDKGVSHPSELEGVSEPPVTVHGGCVSLLVDLWALAAWTQEAGGEARLPAHAHLTRDILRTAAFVFGASGPRTAACLSQLVDGFGPADHYHVVQAVPREGPLAAEAVLTHLRRARFDPVLAARWGPRVTPQACAALQVALHEALEEARRARFQDL